MNNDLKKYYAHLREVAHLQASLSLLQWDQEVMLPVNGAGGRSEQIALLSGILHKTYTKPGFIKLVEKLSVSNLLNSEQKRSVIITYKNLQKNLKISSKFVNKVSAVTSQVFNEWIKARELNDSKQYLSKLSKLIDIKREEISIKYPDRELYDGFLDEHDEGNTSDFMHSLYTSILPGINDVIRRVNSTNEEPEFLFNNYPADRQWQLGLEILKLCGFNFNSGRQDKSAHPFTINNGYGDIRITTRINEHYFPEMLWSSLHELGHALYEQGLPAEFIGAPESEACSISIHESQSRFWENHIGRSKEFIHLIFPIVQNYFPNQLKNVSPEGLYHAVNHIKPGLIRTSADELHYHKHIYIRFILEEELISGKLNPLNLRDAWNALYEEHIGLKVNDDRDGILQDVHWAHGSFGYFPTYTLGSLYAASFSEALVQDLPDIYNKLSAESFLTIKQWLGEKIYSKGRIFDSQEICKSITGEKLNTAVFLKYIQKKFNHNFSYL